MTTLPLSLRQPLGNCRGVLVDSNVLLDITSGDPRWARWSAHALDECAEYSELFINPIIYAEVSIRIPTVEALDVALPRDEYVREALPWEAAFLAGKCFVAYRNRGGPRESLLPDFYIGAHAAIGDLALLTRDDSVYRTYFPRLEVIAP
ncbi:MAG TPA: type II toxin-antitoxin system VapC family toxin [Silvibacterium sp.]|nr:type II toxin-antitoxin system VapC family toxin [Silvibacterium sp.]